MSELDRHITGNYGLAHPDNDTSNTDPDCHHCGKEGWGEYIYLGEYYCEDCLLEQVFAPVIIHIEKQVFGEEGQNGTWNLTVSPKSDQVTGITFWGQHITIFSDIELTLPIDQVTKLLTELENAK